MREERMLYLQTTSRAVISSGVSAAVRDCCCERAALSSVARRVRELSTGERGMGFDRHLCASGLDGSLSGSACIAVGSGRDGIII